MSGTVGAIQDAVRAAFNLYDEWNEVTGFPQYGTSYYYEIQGLIEDAVEIGVAMGCEGKSGINKTLQRIIERNEGKTINANNLKCCGNCEYWSYKYQECEHPEQPQGNTDMKAPTDTCDLWEWSMEMQ